MKPYLLALPLLALGAASFSPHAAADRQADRAARALAGLVPGETLDCVPGNRVVEIQPVPGGLLFREGSGSVFRNTPNAGCERGLVIGDLVTTETVSGQFCKGDTVRMRARIGGQVTGACALGEFTAYRRAP